MTTTSPRPDLLRRPAAAVAALVGALALLLSTVPAAAQTDPYGGTSTTTTAPVQVTATVGQDQGVVGATVTGQVTGAPQGSRVEIYFDGQLVAELVAGAGSTSFSFQVPNTTPGFKEIRAVGATFDVGAIGPDGDERYRVLNPNSNAGGNGNGNGNGNVGVDGNGNVVGGVDGQGVGGEGVQGVDTSRGGSGGVLGSLPRTGVAIGTLALAGLVMVVAGRVLVGRRARA